MIGGKQTANLLALGAGIMAAGVFSTAALGQGTEPLFKSSGQVPGAVKITPGPAVQPPVAKRPVAKRPVAKRPESRPPPQANATHPALRVLTANDRKLFGLMDQSRKRGFAAAQQGNPKVLAQITAILDAPARKISPRRLRGNWRCRTFALGGTLGPRFAASKTSFFRCRITSDGKHLKLRKTSGSMAWLGWLRVLGDDRMLYYGTAIAIDDKMPIYPKTRRYSSHQVGLVQQIGVNRMRIEMPMPSHTASSFHDVVELVRITRRRRR